MKNTREIAKEYRLASWAEMMRRRQESGLSIKKFCQSEGMHPNKYHYWQRKLREAAVNELLPIQAHSTSAVPIGWTQIDVREDTEKAESSGISIEIGKMRVVAQSESDMDLLAKVCKALSNIC